MDFHCLSSGVIAKKLPLVGFNFEILALALLQVLNQALIPIFVNLFANYGPEVCVSLAFNDAA